MGGGRDILTNRTLVTADITNFCFSLFLLFYMLKMKGKIPAIPYTNRLLEMKERGGVRHIFNI